MNNTKIRDLGQVRDILAEWEMVRQALVAGVVAGFHVGLLDQNGAETIYVGGVYKSDPEAAARAALRAWMKRMLNEDEPPIFQASSS
jgi:hypothetical protein